MVPWHYFVAVIALLVAGLASIIYTIPHVSKIRRPLYWGAIVMNLLLLTVHVAAAGGQWFGWHVPGRGLQWLVAAAITIVAIQTILVPWADRVEARLIHLRGRQLFDE